MGKKKKRSFPAKRIFLSYHDVKNTYFGHFDTRTAGKLRYFFFIFLLPSPWMIGVGYLRRTLVFP